MKNKRKKSWLILFTTLIATVLLTMVSPLPASAATKSADFTNAAGYQTIGLSGSTGWIGWSVTYTSSQKDWISAPQEGGVAITLTVTKNTGAKRTATVFCHGDTIYVTQAAGAATYTVSYNANGGSGAPSAQPKTQGVNLTLSSAKPTKSFTLTYNANGGTVSPANKSVACTFKNWNTNSAGTGTTYQSGGTYSANASATLYAQWTNPTAGTLATPTRTGHTFSGWYTAASGGTQITSASTISANTPLYARWSAGTYTITYNANGGSGAPASQTKTQDVNITLRTTKPIRTGYTFQGWGTSSTATSVSYKAGATYSENAAKTLYAVWKSNSPTSQTIKYIDTKTFSESGGSATYAFQYAPLGEWTPPTSSASTWLKVTGYSRTQNTFSIKVEPNTTGKQRSGTITYVTNSGIKVIFQFTQTVNIHVQKISLKTPLSVPLGKSATTVNLSNYLTVSPSNATIKTVMWNITSVVNEGGKTDTSVASWNLLGTLTGSLKISKPGKVVVTATSIDGGKKATITINISREMVTSINLIALPLINKYSNGYYILETGKTLTPIAITLPDTAPRDNLIWSSSNTKVATVDSTGKITARSVGISIITCTANGGVKVNGKVVSASLKVMVGDISLGFAVKEENSTKSFCYNTDDRVKSQGESNPNIYKFVVVAKDGKTIFPAEYFDWSSNNKAAATVSEKGEVKIVGKGNFKITAKIKSQYGSTSSQQVVLMSSSSQSESDTCTAGSHTLVELTTTNIAVYVAMANIKFRSSPLKLIVFNAVLGIVQANGVENYQLCTDCYCFYRRAEDPRVTKTIKYMRDMATIKWTSSSVNMPGTSYAKNTLYSGIPYYQLNRDANFENFGIPITGVTAQNNLADDEEAWSGDLNKTWRFKSINTGNDCISALLFAYNYAGLVTLDKNATEESFYAYWNGIKQTTSVILKDKTGIMFGNTTIIDWADVKPGDFLHRSTGVGHVRLVTSVKNGTIEYIDQSSYGVSSGTLDDGTKWSSSWNIDRTVTEDDKKTFTPYRLNALKN